MNRELTFGEQERTAAEELIDLALSEDLDSRGDLTSSALIDASQQATVQVVSRAAGILAGGPVAEMVFTILDATVAWKTLIADGSAVEPGMVVAEISGPLRALLTGERTALNFLTHLSGVATLTGKFVTKIENAKACVLDTRKTLPGYRVLQKYAVRAGGGTNHRMGLYDGVLIKDNHLAAWCGSFGKATIADAIRQARSRSPKGTSIEVEVDTLAQLKDALAGEPDIVLLDNMSPEVLRQAVAIRDQQSAGVLLEASGNVNLKTIAEMAQSGVERISIGGLTHSATALDLGFDWKALNDEIDSE